MEQALRFHPTKEEPRLIDPHQHGSRSARTNADCVVVLVKCRKPRFKMTLHLASKGFTLVEILVVTTTLLLLVALIVPALGSVIAKSHRAGCLSNLRAIGGGLQMHAADNNGWLPPESSSGANGKGKGAQWDSVIMPYLGIATGTEVKTVFFCPASKRYSPSKVPLSQNLSYGYNRYVAENLYGSGRMATIENPSKLILVSDLERAVDSNENYTTGGGKNNIIFISAKSEAIVDRMTYKRHRGAINLLFADGSAGSRPPVGEDGGSGMIAKFPRGIQWHNRGATTSL
jgi:prepilin-type processing-associated H-X9-DG protein